MNKITNKRGYSIGELSRYALVNIETIRYYERVAVMPEPERSSGGNRIYNEQQIKRLFFIKRCRDLGFSLDGIRAMLSMVDDDNLSCRQVHNRTVSHLDNISKKLKDLRKMQAVLKQMAATCSKGDVPDCPIVDSLFEFDPLTAGGKL